MEDVVLDDEEVEDEQLVSTKMLPPPVPSFRKAPAVKKKVGLAALGIKKKEAQPQLEKKAALVSYDSDSD
jgi:hypothetical protein